MASRHGHLSIVRLLLEHSDPDGRGCTDRTPLSYAAQKGHTAVAKLLLAEPRVDPNARDSHGRTALSYAATHGNEAIMSLLLGHSSDPNSEDDDGRTPLSYAVEAGNVAAVRMLLGKVAVDPTYRDKKGMDLLGYAVTAGRPNKDIIIKILTGSRTPPISHFSFELELVHSTH